VSKPRESGSELSLLERKLSNRRWDKPARASGTVCKDGADSEMAAKHWSAANQNSFDQNYVHCGPAVKKPDSTKLGLKGLFLQYSMPCEPIE
jgi:hypothetical protein